MAKILLLAAAIALFGLTHLTPGLPRLRAWLRERLGAGYLTAFILMSFLTTTAVGWLWATSDFIPLYDPPAWGPHVTFALMFCAFVLFGIFLFPCRLKRRLRSPFSLVILFWGTGHLLANGDLATVTLAAGMMIVAAGLLWLTIRNGVRPQARDGAALDALAVATGIILYLGMAAYHDVLIGMPILHYIGLDG